MTAKEKVLKVWPDAVVYWNKITRSWFWYRESSAGPSSGEFISEVAAWQNAAESLPPQPEMEAPVAGGLSYEEHRRACMFNLPAYVFGSSPKPVAPLPTVEAKEGNRLTFEETKKRFGLPSHPAETKPTPSVGIVKNKATGETREFWNHVESIAQQVKPQPDSSSISTTKLICKNCHKPIFADISYVHDDNDMVCDDGNTCAQPAASTEQTFENCWDEFRGKLPKTTDPLRYASFFQVAEFFWNAAKGCK